ncbi:hypothetical protein [Streptomyces violascens]|uniref:hypothetical protein n=1 Tax=Streptomyces violascens TaxID=67381 RepID=UPI001674D5B4|nr:hypothetical protein [Streptomyces violascens]
MFSTAPSEEPNLEVPAYRAGLQLEKFYVRRAVGDQWGGKDEIYWTAAASSDKHKAPVYMSQEFGAVKEGDTRTFSADNKVVFDGPAAERLGLVVAAWEADQSNAPWYDALFRALQQMVDALWLIDLGLGIIQHPSTDLWSLAFEITKIFIFLKEQVRNHDDLSCARTIILDRRALVTLSPAPGRRLGVRR